MASKIEYFSGTCKWAKIKKPDEKYNVYKIDLYMDNPSFDKFLKSGIQVAVKKSEEGEAYVTLRRDVEKLIKGEKVAFGSPTVLNTEGEPYPETPLIGNGSKVTCKVVIYDTIKGKGHRLEAIRIDDLVAYDEGGPDDGAPF